MAQQQGNNWESLSLLPMATGQYRWLSCTHVLHRRLWRAQPTHPPKKDCKSSVVDVLIHFPWQGNCEFQDELPTWWAPAQGVWLLRCPVHWAGPWWAALLGALCSPWGGRELLTLIEQNSWGLTPVWALNKWCSSEQAPGSHRKLALHHICFANSSGDIWFNAKAQSVGFPVINHPC